ncbi:MAG: hypothetical protein GC201_06075 [Alphaproteobacteria bacterium]|nr:hypothetical protein [Alphaproteobacteria bacterium]
MSTVTQTSFRIGGIISQSFSVLSRNVVPFGVLALLFVAVPQLVLNKVFFGTMVGPGAGFSFGNLRAIGAMGIISAVLALILYGSLVFGTFRDLSGRPASVGDSIGRGLATALPILGLFIVAGIAIGIGYILFIIPGVILSLMWAVAVPAAVVERPGVFAALGRSADLTRGHRWQILGLALVYAVIVIAFTIAVGLATLIVSFVPLLPVLVTAVANALVAAFGAVTFTVLYSELRRIKDGVGVDAIAQVFD